VNDEMESMLKGPCLLENIIQGFTGVTQESYKQFHLGQLVSGSRSDCRSS
jgi:hypothetical protein